MVVLTRSKKNIKINNIIKKNKNFKELSQTVVISLYNIAKTTIKKKYEYIYLLQEREFIRTNDNVFKIGRTSQSNTERIRSYSKGSQLLFMIKCKNSIKTEKKLLYFFDNLFNRKKEYGREYYEGDHIKMIDIIYNYVINEK
jgi:hypothetical protein